VRLFLAVPVPPSPGFAQATADLVREVPGARPVPEGSWHATVRFLGEVAEAQPVIAAVGPVAARHPTIPVAVRGVGAFPDPRKARVVWAGMEAPGLDRLAADIAQATPLARDPERGRPFHAHVTLARLDRPRDVRTFVQGRVQASFSAGAISEVVLFRSELTPQGPQYTKMASFPLAP